MVKEYVNILWVSRYTLTSTQKEDLKRIYGNISITQCSETIHNTKELAGVLYLTDIIAVVLPPELIQELKKITDKPIIRSVAGRIETGKMVTNLATGEKEKEFRFEHKHWEQIEKIEIITKKL